MHPTAAKFGNWISKGSLTLQCLDGAAGGTVLGLQLLWSHLHPAKVVIARQGQFVLGSCTDVLKWKKEKKIARLFFFLNGSACYWMTCTLGASLSGEVDVPPTQGAWWHLGGGRAVVWAGIGSGLKWSFLIDFGFLWPFIFSRWGNSVSVENDTDSLQSIFVERRMYGMLFSMLEVISIAWNRMIFLGTVP